MPLTWANKITITRIVLIPIFLVNVLSYQPDRDYFRFIALFIFMIAAILDLLDGYVARRGNEETKLGAMLDPLADKMLLATAFLSLYVVGFQFPLVHFPVWLVITVISRDVILLVGALMIQLTRNNLLVRPDRLGKLAACSQFVCVAWILLQWRGSDFLWGVTCVLTVLSGLNYLRQGIGEFNGN
jgi:cardiolipin synthase